MPRFYVHQPQTEDPIHWMDKETELESKLFELYKTEYVLGELRRRQTPSTIDPEKGGNRRLQFRLRHQKWIQQLSENALGLAKEVGREILAVFEEWLNFHTGSFFAEELVEIINEGGLRGSTLRLGGGFEVDLAPYMIKAFIQQHPEVIQEWWQEVEERNMEEDPEYQQDFGTWTEEDRVNYVEEQMEEVYGYSWDSIQSLLGDNSNDVIRSVIQEYVYPAWRQYWTSGQSGQQEISIEEAEEQMQTAHDRLFNALQTNDLNELFVAINLALHARHVTGPATEHIEELDAKTLDALSNLDTEELDQFADMITGVNWRAAFQQYYLQKFGSAVPEDMLPDIYCHQYSLTKTANRKNRLKKSDTYIIHDVDRYLTDDYAINLALNETKDRFSLGVYITNYKVGLGGYQQYWHYKKSEKQHALRVYRQVKKIASDLVDEIEYENITSASIKPQLRARLDDVDVFHKEKSGVFHFNYFATDAEKEPDWRYSIYGGRYPEHPVDVMSEEWTNTDSIIQKIEHRGSGRNKIVQSKYLLATSDIVKKLQKLWPTVPIMTIMGFLTWYEMNGGTKEQLVQEIAQSPSTLTEIAPEFNQPIFEEQTAPEPQSIGSDNFQNALNTVLANEGGYVNHPNDPGGETNQGITRRTYEGWLQRNQKQITNLNMKEIPQEDVQAIYYEQYWQPVSGDQLPEKVALQMLDYAVNSGPQKAVRDLQTIVGSNTDGISGPKTLKAVTRYVQKYGENTLANKILERREIYLDRLGHQRQYRDFHKGWMNRIETMRSHLTSKDMKMREKDPPKQRVLPFVSEQMNYIPNILSSKKWEYRF